MTRQIEEALRWSGVAWDEGPFLQSERSRGTPSGAPAARRGQGLPLLLHSEQLDPLRREAEREGRTFRYPRPARTARRRSGARRAAGEPRRCASACTTRRSPGTTWCAATSSSLPSARRLRAAALRRQPHYHLSVVVDDVDMDISLVLRGEDHVSNTPKHIRLFESLGAALPSFGHLPLILGPDKRRLSKRTGATSVEEFRAQGFLPEAFYNFLALLGWSPGDGRELMSREELVAAFSLDRVSNAAAVFDPEKLLWMNGQYLWKLAVRELVARGAPFAAAAGSARMRRTPLFAAAGGCSSCGRARWWSSPSTAALLPPSSPTYEARAANTSDRRLDALLGSWRRGGRLVEEWQKERLDEALRALAGERGVSGGAHPPGAHALPATTAGPTAVRPRRVMWARGDGGALGRYRGYLGDLPAV